MSRLMTPRRRSLALAVSALAFLTACSVGDDYQRPVTGTPAGWSYADGDMDASWPDAAWWKNFKAKPLDDLIAESLAANQDIKSAVATVRAADAQVGIAGGALLPTVGASAGASHQLTPGSGQTSGKVSNTFSIGPNASYELDFWGKNRAAVESAQASAQASRFDLEITRLTVMSSVATTYFTIIGTEQRIEAARKNLADAEKLLDAYQRRLKNGTASALDVAGQESTVASERAVIPTLVETLQQNCNALALLAGRLPETMDVNTLAIPGGLSGVFIPAPGAGLSSGLLERRPDVQAAEQNLIAANANITEARAAFFPDITLTGQYGFQSAALASLFGPASLLYSVAGSATQTLFNASLIPALDYSQAYYDELIAAYRKAVLSAFSDTENSLSAASQTQAADAANSANLEAARKAYDLTRRQFDNGIADITSVMVAERAVFTAEDTFIQGRIARLQAIVSLYNSLGGGWSAADSANPS